MVDIDDAILIAENQDDLHRLILGLTAIRPILTCAAKTRSETLKTSQIMETTEMKVIERIAGKTVRDRERSTDTRQTCQIGNINEWVLNRKNE